MKAFRKLRRKVLGLDESARRLTSLNTEVGKLGAEVILHRQRLETIAINVRDTHQLLLDLNHRSLILSELGHRIDLLDRMAHEIGHFKNSVTSSARVAATQAREASDHAHRASIDATTILVLIEAMTRALESANTRPKYPEIQNSVDPKL